MNERTIGWVIGVIVGLILVPILLKQINKNGKVKTEYDEMQKINKTKSYFVGFVATMIYVALLMILSTFEISIPAEERVILFSIIFVGIVSSVSASIWNDSYWGLTTNRVRFWILMIVCGIINIGVPIIDIIRGTFFVDGKIGITGINLMCGALFLILALQSIIKSLIEKRAGDEDEEC